jgi:hypothetical protein
MLPVLAREDDRAASFNLGDRPITALESPVDLCVELEEEIIGGSHMICGSRIKNLAVVVVGVRGTQVREHPCSLMWTWRDVDEPSCAGTRLKTVLCAKSKLCSSSSPWTIWAWASSSLFFILHSRA